MSFTEDFKIPDKLVGLVIGRGGEQIKRLQMESGCKIRIASDGDGTMDRLCTLTAGSQEAIDEAKRRLNDVVARGVNRERGNFNNNAGGGGYGQNNNGGGQFGGNRRYNNGGGQGGYNQHNQF